MRLGPRIKILLLIGIILWCGPRAHSDGQQPVSGSRLGSGKVFLYTAKKLGVPILKASIKIENGSLEQKKPLYQIHADVYSLPYLGILFRMKNRFISTVEAETLAPLQYIKEIDQEGLLIERKNYLQTLTFDYSNKKIVMEKSDKNERREIPVPSETCDPLSMFARYYLKEELHPGHDIQMSIYDGVKLRQMIFHSKQGRIKSKRFGEVEAVCLESTTSFATFEDKEGIIRIWYTTDGKKIPISMELDLPIGSVKFELEEVRES